MSCADNTIGFTCTFHDIGKNVLTGLKCDNKKWKNWLMLMIYLSINQSINQTFLGRWTLMEMAPYEVAAYGRWPLIEVDSYERWPLMEMAPCERWSFMGGGPLWRWPLMKGGPSWWWALMTWSFMGGDPLWSWPLMGGGPSCKGGGPLM